MYAQQVCFTKYPRPRVTLCGCSWSRDQDTSRSRGQNTRWSRGQDTACAVWLFSTLLLSSKGKFTLIAQLDLHVSDRSNSPIVLCPCWLDWLDFQQLAPSPWHLCSQDKFCLYIIEIRSLYRSLVLYSRVGTYLASYWSLTNSSAVLYLSLRVNRLRIRRYNFDHHHCGRSACAVQRAIIDLSGICSLYRLKAAPQIHNLFHQKLQLQDTKTFENVML